MPNNILITPGSASIQFSGSLANTIRLQVEPSGSIAFYGNSGSLFGITDSLVGSLMSANDISGLPIFEVFSDDRVVMGTYNQNTLVVTGSRVGMGTATPSSNLHLYTTSTGVEILVEKSSTYANRFGVNSSNVAYVGSNNATALQLQTNTQARVYIEAGGNVGIGTTSPATPLDVNGGVAGTGGWNRTATLSATFPTLIFNSNGTKWGGIAYDYTAAMRFWVNAGNNDIYSTTAVMSILNNGNVGIGTTSPGTLLDVNGVARATTFTSTQATGTSPFTVSSTTVVTNLNTDTVDGLHATSFMRSAGTENAGTIIIRDNRSTTNYYNTVALEIRSADQKAVIGLHRDGYSHCGISHEASNALRFNFNAGDVYLNYNAGTLWGSGNDGAGSGLDADLLDGYSSATTATANTIALRDANGDLTNRYNFATYNNTSDDVSSSTITYIMAKFGDNYHRSATAAKVAAFISGQSMNISGTSTNITAYTINQNVGTGNAPQWLYIGVNPSGVSNNGYGISLYGGASTSPTYGIFFQGTGTYGTHGNVTADWATYFTMDSTANRGWIFRNQSTSTNIASINNSGFATFAGLGVGTPGASTEVRATGEITAYYGSDKRLKENIQPLNNALNKLLRVNGVEFDWTEEYINKRGGEDGYFVRKHDVGIIAQEIQEVLPEVVAERTDGYLAVRYEKIVPLLIEAIKELQAEVVELKRQL